MQKTAFVCVIMVLALTLTGFGFAKWSDTVTIEHSVATGDVEVGIVTTAVLDQGADPNQAPGDNSEEKDVASTLFANDTAICTSGYYESTTVAITNAYPWYKTGATMELKNLGTIPVKIEDIEATGVCGNIWDFIFIDRYEVEVTGENPIIEESGPYTWEDVIASIGNCQLHSGDVLELNFDMYFAQYVDGVEMPELISDQVTYTVTASQWNEV